MKKTNNFSPVSFKPFKILAFHSCRASLHIPLCIFLINPNFSLISFCYHRYFREKAQNQFDEGLNFTGVPFIIAGTKIFDCQHGIDRKVIAKEKI